MRMMLIAVASLVAIGGLHLTTPAAWGVLFTQAAAHHCVKWGEHNTQGQCRCTGGRIWTGSACV